MIADWKEFRELALELTRDGYIPVFDGLCDELEEIVVECIFTAVKYELKEVTLLINSNGGSNDCLTSIKAAMRKSNIVFTGLVMSRAKSNGFLLLQYCQKRVAIPNSELLFHFGAINFYNSEVAALRKKRMWPLEHLMGKVDVMIEKIHRRTGVSLEDLEEFALYERTFSAEEALKLHFLDEILEELPEYLATIATITPEEALTKLEQGNY